MFGAGPRNFRRRSGGRASQHCSCSPIPREAAPTPGSRRCRTTSMCSQSRGCTPARSPCSTWRYRSPSPPGASFCCTCCGTGGRVSTLVVLYSLSVFLTFAVSLFGLCLYWARLRAGRNWLGRLALSAAGFLVCAGILLMLLVEKFLDGGWLTVVIIAAIIAVCVTIRNHYDWAKAQLKKIDADFSGIPFGSVANPPKPDPNRPTAAFLVGSSRGGGLHALLWVQRMFPDHFKNFIFVNARTVDAQSFGGREDLEAMKVEANASLSYFVNFCNSKGWAAKSYLSFGTDPIDEFTRLAERVRGEFSNAIFFTSKLIFDEDNWLTQILHNQAAIALQRRFHLRGMQMVILPMKLSV